MKICVYYKISKLFCTLEIFLIQYLEKYYKTSLGSLLKSLLQNGAIKKWGGYEPESPHLGCPQMDHTSCLWHIMVKECYLLLTSTSVEGQSNQNLSDLKSNNFISLA